MKWLIFLVAVILSSGTRAAEERVVSFHSNVQIDAKGWLTVTETIDINVEGRQIKRGILRDFPTDYKDRLGRKVTVPFQVISVLRDGRRERHVVERKANGASVRIGDPGSMLAHRRHVYEIVYRTRFQVGFFDKHDELYWNVNGNGWTFVMDSVSAAVALPAAVSTPVPAADIKVEAYTGSFGATGRDYEAKARDGGADFQSTRRLKAGEGLTIVFMFPKGVVFPPTLAARFDRWLDDNLGEALGAAGLLVFLSFLYLRWAQFGRDPRAGPPFPRYEAPEGLGPAAVRYMDQMGYDDRCFSAALLGLAQRGFMRIKEDGGSYELERTGQVVPFTPGDVAVAAIVPKSGPITLSASYQPAVAAAQVRLATTLEEEVGARYYSLNRGSITLALVIAAVTLGTMYFLDVSMFVIVPAGLLMLGALIVAWKLLPAYTAEGRKRMDEIDGLRQYLTVAEQDDLERQKRPPRTAEEFARFLPYAVALGVAKTWADAFAAVIGSAAVAAAVSTYYSSSSTDNSNFSAEHLADSVGGISDTISSASTAPGSSSGSSGMSSSGGSSSSSSSSGSSGGGGGGGGGSGW